MFFTSCALLALSAAPLSLTPLWGVNTHFDRPGESLADADATLYFAPGAEADAGVGAGGAAGGAAGACWTVLDVMGELHGEPVCRGEDGRLALKVNDSPRYLLPAARIVT